MMQILIAAIGKLKSGPEYDLCMHYTKHLGWKVQFKEFDIKKTLSSLERKRQEGLLLFENIEDGDYVIALDENGKEFSSQHFASYLRIQQELAIRRMVFVIGGADGLHESVQERADIMIAFGRATWPHMLARAMLCEQLYRAHTILTNHPYHRA